MATAETARPRILLVDDDRALLASLSGVLKTRIKDIVVETACAGDAALLRVAAIDYDAIITDLAMPGTGGLALLREVRRLRPETPLIMITGFGDRQLEKQATRLGAYAFVYKPMTGEKIVTIVKRAIQRAQLVRRARQRDVEDKIQGLKTSELAGDSLAVLQRAREMSERLQGKMNDLVDPASKKKSDA